MKADVIIVGSGVAGLFSAIKLPIDKKILIITKAAALDCDSYLAQGGICVKRDKDDFQPFFQDTLKAGHYENDEKAVTLMIEKSQEVINALVECGVEFETMDKASKAISGCGVSDCHNVIGDKFVYTKEGAHSKARILYHKDITGKEITTKLLKYVKKMKNVTILENTEMVDIIEEENRCYGVLARKEEKIISIFAENIILATGGVGGIYKDSTNFPHITGDGLLVALKHKIKLKNPDYVQIHPTALCSKKEGRRFLITESVRGEGGILLNKSKERFVDELLPRDMVAKAIYDEMKKENSKHVWLSLENIDRDVILNHFPNIYNRCKEDGIDITKEPIPVVPAQHYYMGGIEVDYNSQTSMSNLYAVGETSCNGVHGRNRLASNSLLESLVFAQQAATHIFDTQLHQGRANKEPEKTWLEYSKEEFPIEDTNLKKELESIVKGRKSYA